ncbi:hypothetical protein CR513_07888, partial [Mucuna pruriens]
MEQSEQNARIRVNERRLLELVLMSEVDPSPKVQSRPAALSQCWLTGSQAQTGAFASDLANSVDFDFDPSEDPHKHHKEFHVVCSTKRPHGILEDYIKMKEFPFSLTRATKDWLCL